MMDSKTFFVKLKETCRKIDSDVNDIKAKKIASHEDKEEVISKKICEIRDKISALKTDASDAKNMLGPKVAHTRDFIKNFKEFMTEIEVSVSKKEEYLKQYGYKPAELAPLVPEIQLENNVTPDKKMKVLPTTPNLLDYGIPSYTLTVTPELNQKSSVGSLVASLDLDTVKPIKCRSHSDSTPTLDILAIIPTCKSKETPPLPEPLYTPAKETPPVPEYLAYNAGNISYTPKLNL